MTAMFAHLLFYQFAFLYLLALVIGLVVYGSDFDGIAGWLYVLPLLLIQASHRWVWRRRFSLISGFTPKVIYAAGAIAGLLAYNDLHVQYWDEHSVFQAGCIAILGVCSYLSSVIAAVHLNKEPGQCEKCQTYALLLIGLMWLSANWYPMAVVFLLALLLAIAAIWQGVLQASAETQKTGYESADFFARYTVFLLAMDFSSTVWDYQTNTQWAVYLAIGFISAAVGNYFTSWKNISEQYEQWVYVIAILNFVVATFWPAYLLAFVHIVITGVCLGFLLPKAVFRQANGQATESVANSAYISFGWITWFFLGLVIAYAWYANLSMAGWRVILAIPFLLLFISFLYLKFKLLKYKN